MRVFIPNEDWSDFTYPEDVKIIMNYLNFHGTVKVSVHTIVDAYYDFCDEYYSASWMELSEQILSEFANYLSEKEI